MKKLCLITLAALLVIAHAFAADGSNAKKSKAPESAGSTPFSVGIGVKVSTLGIGGDVAVPVTRRTNARVGFNAFNYNHTFNDVNGVDYKGTLSLRSAQAQFDVFPFAGSFHLSPGIMFYNGNKFGADALVKPGSGFELSKTTYFSSTTDPLKGTARLEMSRVNPMFTLGWGNLVPRKAGRHVTFGFEAGFVYQGSPNIKLNYSGTACTTSAPSSCQNVSSFAAFQSDKVKEQNRLNDKVSPFRFYPIISTGVGYRF